MNGSGSQPPERVPTLTEVVAWPESPPRAASPAAAIDARLIDAEPTDALPLPSLRIPEEQMIQRVLAEVQRQVDLTIEYRLREVLTPLLTLATDSVIRESRSELASALRDVVARAVAQELARHRTR